MKCKTLKLFNGRGSGKFRNGTMYISAYSQTHARELLETVTNSIVNKNEIQKYFHKGTWGNMIGIIPTEPSVYFSIGIDKPYKIL